MSRSLGSEGRRREVSTEEDTEGGTDTNPQLIRHQLVTISNTSVKREAVEEVINRKKIINNATNTE